MSNVRDETGLEDRLGFFPQRTCSSQTLPAAGQRRTLLCTSAALAQSPGAVPAAGARLVSLCWGARRWHPNQDSLQRHGTQCDPSSPPPRRTRVPLVTALGLSLLVAVHVPPCPPGKLNTLLVWPVCGADVLCTAILSWGHFFNQRPLPFPAMLL